MPMWVANAGECLWLWLLKQIVYLYEFLSEGAEETSLPEHAKNDMTSSAAHEQNFPVGVLKLHKNLFQNFCMISLTNAAMLCKLLWDLLQGFDSKANLPHGSWLGSRGIG